MRFPSVECGGIVLAGGRSRRLGQDKRQVQLGESTLLELAVSKARSVCADVVVVSPADNRPPVSGVRWVPDCDSLAGPMAGLVAGLEALSTPCALALACDMPFVTEELLRHLVSQISGEWFAAVPRVAGRWQPLCGVYTKPCAALMREECSAERAALKHFLDDHREKIHRLDESSLKQFGDLSALFANVNTQADVWAARRRACVR